MNVFEKEYAEEMVTLGDTILNEFKCTGRATPLQYVLKKMREDSSIALLRLIDAEPEDSAQIRKLQNEVKRYTEFVKYLHTSLVESTEAAIVLSAEDRSEMSKLEGQITPQGDFYLEGTEEI